MSELRQYTSFGEIVWLLTEFERHCDSVIGNLIAGKKAHGHINPETVDKWNDTAVRVSALKLKLRELSPNTYNDLLKAVRHKHHNKGRSYD